MSDSLVIIPTYNEKENYTLAHFRERINIYNEEDFNYEIHNVDLK